MDLKNAILKNGSTKLEAVLVEEWNLTVYLKPLSVAGRAEVFAKVSEKEKATLPAWLVLYTLCNERGELVFTADDFAALAGQDATVIDRLAKKAAELNGIEAAAVEEAKKN